VASSICVAPLILELVAASAAAGAQAAATPARPDALGEFPSIAAQAKAAREASRIEEAISLYRRAVGARRDWEEGWWYLGTLQYERGRGSEARDAFSRFVELKPDSGPGWTLRGLSTALTDPVAALEDLQKGLDLGLGGNAELTRAGRHQQALGLLKSGQFERAVPPLTLLARTSPEAPWLVSAIGLLVLRTPALPSEVSSERRQLLMAAGRAGYLHLALRAEEAGKAYEALVASYPDEPWVHYAHGVFLLRSDSDRALAELAREVQVKPDNVMAHLEIAFERIVRGEYEQARPAAERAASLAPGLFAARNALGRVLVELGEVERGTLELEEAVRLAPEVPELHFALARAYGKAGRAEDAARERATFADLDQKRRAKQAAGAATPPGGGQP
jgi:tetratricopeptide (TPR) repeat protein